VATEVFTEKVAQNQRRGETQAGVREEPVLQAK
jgi:hypothetical protein